MVAGSLRLRQRLAVGVRADETAEIAALAKPLLLTKKRVIFERHVTGGRQSAADKVAE
jgi:hypothetical protein